MVPHSKFLELLESNRQFLTEGNFVKGSEKSELPPTGDYEEPEGEPVEEPVDQPVDQPESEEPKAATDPYSVPWDGREINVLHLAVKLFTNYEQDDLSKINEIQSLWDSKNYGKLYDQLTRLDELSPV